MDPLSIAGSVVAILGVAGSSGQFLNKLLSLRGAPVQLQQMWNEAEALRSESWPDLFQPPLLWCREEDLTSATALLLETQRSLHRRRESDGYIEVEASITPVLQTVRAHVLEFEQLIQ